MFGGATRTEQREVRMRQQACCGGHAHSHSTFHDGLEKNPSHHLISLAETSVGPTLSYDYSHTELSKEMPSTSQIDPLAGDSMMTSEGFDPLASTSEHQTSVVFDSQRALEDDAMNSLGYHIQRTGLAAMVEVPRLNLQHGDSMSSSIGPPAISKRTLHIASAPYHECVAFDKADLEKDRFLSVAHVSQLMNPITKQRFQDLQEAGKFPRRRLIGHQRTGSFSARGIESPLDSAYDQGPHTARASLRQDGQESYVDEEVEPPGGPWQQPSRRLSNASNSRSSGRNGSMLSMKEPHPDLAPTIANSLSNRESLRHYFPASAEASY